MDFYPLPLLTAAACGLLTALVFAIWPLRARARGVAGRHVSRAAGAAAAAAAGGRLIGLGLSLAALGALAVAGVADRRLGAIFVGVRWPRPSCWSALALLVLRGVRLVGRRGSAHAHRAANLHRPGAGRTA